MSKDLNEFVSKFKELKEESNLEDKTILITAMDSKSDTFPLQLKTMLQAYETPSESQKRFAIFYLAETGSNPFVDFIKAETVDEIDSVINQTTKKLNEIGYKSIRQIGQKRYH